MVKRPISLELKIRDDSLKVKMRERMKKIIPATREKDTGSYPRNNGMLIARVQRKFVYPSTLSPSLNTNPFPWTRL
jgi:hypothetical protein